MADFEKIFTVCFTFINNFAEAKSSMSNVLKRTRDLMLALREFNSKTVYFNY